MGESLVRSDTKLCFIILSYYKGHVYIIAIYAALSSSMECRQPATLDVNIQTIWWPPIRLLGLLEI